MIGSQPAGLIEADGQWPSRPNGWWQPRPECQPRRKPLRSGPAIFADDMPIELQAPGNGKTKTARIWTYVRDERPWHGPDPPAAHYRFTVNRKGEHPASHLHGYQSWMHAAMTVLPAPGSSARRKRSGWRGSISA
jgi:transposase